MGKSSGESDAMIADILHLSCHDIDSNKTYHTSEIVRMDQTLKGGRRSMR